MSIETADFGRKLAHTDKKERDIAVKQLINYISNLSELTLEESLKLWKGLYYCYWMSDKPPVQQHLAIVLSGLVASLPPTHATVYLQGFWVSMVKEWHGLDRIRLNKFYLLIRKVHLSTMKWIASMDWDEKYIAAYSDILTESPLKANDSKVPLGITFHTLESLLVELETASGGDVPQKALHQILQPFAQLLSQTINSVIRDRIQEEIFDKLLLKNDEDEMTFKFTINQTQILHLLYSCSISDTITKLNKKYIDTMVLKYVKALEITMDQVVYFNENIIAETPTPTKIVSRKAVKESKIAAEIVIAEVAEVIVPVVEKKIAAKKEKMTKKKEPKQQAPVIATYSAPVFEDINAMEIIPEATPVKDKKRKQKEVAVKQPKAKKEKVEHISESEDMEDDPEAGWVDMGAVNAKGNGPLKGFSTPKSGIVSEGILQSSEKNVKFNQQIDVQPFLKKSNVLSITKVGKRLSEIGDGKSNLRAIGQTFNTSDDGFPVIQKKIPIKVVRKKHVKKTPFKIGVKK